MAIVYAPGNTNIALATGYVDRFGDLWIKKVIPRLVASGRWQITGSGNGQSAGNARFQRKGQTAGLGGSNPWNCLTGDIGGSAASWSSPTNIDSFSNIGAWVDVAELDALGVETGRGFTIQRHNGASANNGFYAQIVVFGFRYTPWTGVASATDPGTEPTVMRMICGNVGAFGFFGSSVAGAWFENLASHDWSCLNSVAATDVWVQLGIEDAPGSKNVCSFVLTIWSKTANLPGGVMYYMELDNTLASESHPIVMGSGVWMRSVGLPGDGAAGPFYLVSGNRVWAGSNLDIATLGRTVNPQFAQIHIPGSAFPPLRGGQNLITRRPEVWTAAGQQGVMKYAWVNPFNRNYPSTQDVVGAGGAQPRIYVGQLLFPWAAGVAPASGP